MGSDKKMKEFFISSKMAGLLFRLTIGSIGVLSLLCVLFDKGEEERGQQVFAGDNIIIRDIQSHVRNTNVLLLKQNKQIGEMTGSINAILGIAKGEVGLSPTFEPSVNIYPGKPRKTQPPKNQQKDTVVVEHKDSIVITIDNNVDSITTVSPQVGAQGCAYKKCCCCCCKCQKCKKGNER